MMKKAILKKKLTLKMLRKTHKKAAVVDEAQGESRSRKDSVTSKSLRGLSNQAVQSRESLSQLFLKGLSLV